MKSLITILFILFVSNINSQVLLIDIEEPVNSLQVRTSNFAVQTEGSLIQLEFQENQKYYLVVNTNHYIELSIKFIDDVFSSLDEIDLQCDCTYRKEGIRLIINFKN